MFGPKTGLQQGYAKTKMGGCKQAAGANEIQNTRACEKDADCGSKPWNICLFSTSLTSNMPCTDCAIGLYNDVQGNTTEKRAHQMKMVSNPSPFVASALLDFILLLLVKFQSIIAHHVLLANTGRQKR
jgi:hypothetical protein